MEAYGRVELEVAEGDQYGGGVHGPDDELYWLVIVLYGVLLF